MTKKITLLICYCLIGIIAVALIISAIVPKNYLPNTNDPDKLTITYIEDNKIQAFYNLLLTFYNTKVIIKESLNITFKDS